VKNYEEENCLSYWEKEERERAKNYVFSSVSLLVKRTVGENPAAADAAGINVFRVRYFSSICGGFLMGVAGSFLSLAHFNSFLHDLTAGRGWICLALIIIGKWKLWNCLLVALLFGIIDAFQFRLQALNLNIPY